MSWEHYHKKPFYKKGWFWVLIIIILLAWYVYSDPSRLSVLQEKVEGLKDNAEDTSEIFDEDSKDKEVSKPKLRNRFIGTWKTGAMGIDSYITFIDSKSGVTQTWMGDRHAFTYEIVDEDTLLITIETDQSTGEWPYRFVSDSVLIMGSDELTWVKISEEEIKASYYSDTGLPPP